VARPVKARVPVIAYLRTSSAANVGSDKDSDKRQREAIAAYAHSAGLELVGEYYDAAVSGADPIDTRPGFRGLLDRIVSNGVRTVVVEDASRFARTLMVQEAGIATLAGIGVQVLTSRGDDLTDSDDEMRVAMRQIAGVFSQLEKTRLVKKLAAARARGRAAGRKVEGRKSFAELAAIAAAKNDRRLLDALAMAKRLRRANPKTGDCRSLRDIAAVLAEAGHISSTGRPYSAKSVRAMLAQRLPGEAFPSAGE
jgi:DNA invertase Pin-like site-specific DNA recombinase